MVSLIRNLKNERKKQKKAKKEGNILCTNVVDGQPVFTKFPVDIGIMKRAANKKIIQTRLDKAQQEILVEQLKKSFKRKK